MANRARSVFEVNALVGATATATSELSGGIAAQAIDLDWFEAGNYGYLSAASPTYPVYLKFDLGSAKAIDSWWIFCVLGTFARSVKDGAIEWSDDNAAWTQAVAFTDLHGATAPTAGRYSVVTHGAGTHRYWRIRIDSNYGDTYVGVNEVIAWDSSLLGASILDDAGTAIVFATTNNATTSKAELTNRVMDSWGAYFNAQGWMDIDFGATRYFGGLTIWWYEADAYVPPYARLYRKTGPNPEDAVELVETVAIGSQGGKVHGLHFSRVYSGRYFRLEFEKAAADSGILLRDAQVHAPLPPAAPAAPSALVVTGDSSDNGALQLRWSHAGASDDNLVGDIDFEVQREKDGGGYSTIATVTSKYYVDSGLAAGSYTYKVRAVNRFHAQASAYTAASTAEVVPVAAAGAGGGGPALQRGLAG